MAEFVGRADGHAVRDRRRLIKGQIRLVQTVNAEPSVVFAFLIDLNRVPEWDRRVQKVTQMTRGPMRSGVILRSTLLIEGMQEHADDEVTDYDPPNRFGLRSVLGATDSVTYELSGTDAGTTSVSVRLSYDLPDAAAGTASDEAGLRIAITNALAHSLSQMAALVENRPSSQGQRI